jgi:hypothetical protein
LAQAKDRTAAEDEDAEASLFHLCDPFILSRDCTLDFLHKTASRRPVMTSMARPNDTSFLQLMPSQVSAIATARAAAAAAAGKIHTPAVPCRTDNSDSGAAEEMVYERRRGARSAEEAAAASSEKPHSFLSFRTNTAATTAPPLPQALSPKRNGTLLFSSRLQWRAFFQEGLEEGRDTGVPLLASAFEDPHHPSERTRRFGSYPPGTLIASFSSSSSFSLSLSPLSLVFAQLLYMLFSLVCVFAFFFVCSVMLDRLLLLLLCFSFFSYFLICIVHVLVPSTYTPGSSVLVLSVVAIRARTWQV